MVREWYPGFRGKTEKGDFIVLRLTDKGYLVEYTSGPWEGKYITMPREIGAKTHEVESLKLTKDQKEDLLDIFYKEFPWEYDTLHNFLLKTTGREPTTNGMAEVLRNQYPPLFQIALNRFFQKKEDD